MKIALASLMVLALVSLMLTNSLREEQTDATPTSDVKVAIPILNAPQDVDPQDSPFARDDRIREESIRFIGTYADTEFWLANTKTKDVCLATSDAAPDNRVCKSVPDFIDNGLALDVTNGPWGYLRAAGIRQDLIESCAIPDGANFAPIAEDNGTESPNLIVFSSQDQPRLQSCDIPYPGGDQTLRFNPDAA